MPRLTNALAVASGAQTKARSKDTLGVVLLLLPTSSP